MSKVSNAFIVLLVFSLLFGCINLNDNSLQKITTLQQKYFVTQSYSTTPVIMTEYLTALADLRKTASGENVKIIEAEIYLAESFNYQNRALSESTKVNYVSFNCASKEAKLMINYITLAFNSANLEEENYVELNSSQKEKLRDNYDILLIGYKEQIENIKTYIETKC
jgi:hypothetical protein